MKQYVCLLCALYINVTGYRMQGMWGSVGAQQLIFAIGPLQQVNPV